MENRSLSLTNLKISHLWFLTLFIKLAISGFVPLMPDETYYWTWAQNLDWGYFDHPAMVAWLWKISLIFGLHGEVARWPVVLIGHLFPLIWIKIYELDFTDEKIKRALFWILSINPVTGFFFFLVTPDVPLLIFMSAAFYFFLKSIKQPSLLSAAGLGVMLGLGFNSKYTIVIMALATLVYALVYTRKQLKVSTLAVIVITGFISSLPVLIWNYQHDFVSFAFQLNHGLGRNDWKPWWTSSFIFSVIVLFNPVTLVALFKKLPTDKISVLSSQFIARLCLAFFLLSSFKGFVEANWSFLALPFVLYIFAIEGRRSWFKFHAWYWGVVYAAFFVIILFPTIRKDFLHFSEPYALKEISKELHNYQPLYGGTYQVASTLWFYMEKPIPKLSEMSRLDQFDFWGQAGKEDRHFYLFLRKDSGLPDWLTKQNPEVTVIQDYSDNFQLLEITLN